MGALVPTQVRSERILPVVKKRAEDRSWRIRWNLASHIPGMLKGLGRGVTMDMEIRLIYSKLLCDKEAEVRSSAATAFVAVMQHIGAAAFHATVTTWNEKAPMLFDDAKKLAMDQSEHVRAALAAALPHVAPILGRDVTVESLLPILLLLLRDESSDVRLGVISSLEPVHEVQ